MACALRENTLRPFAEAGLTWDYLTDELDKSAKAVFDGQDWHAWTTLLSHWDKHHKLMSLDMFRHSFPEAAYTLPKTSYDPAELIEMWQDLRREYLIKLAASDVATMVGEGEHQTAVELLATFHKLITSVHDSRSIIVDWDDKDYDVEARINREIKIGVQTGIAGFDDQPGFYGFQPGNLVCYLGRAKAGKTSFALLSALRAWMDGRRVLFISFEIAAGKLPSEPGIADRLDCFGSGIDLTRYMMGALNHPEKKLLRAFRSENCDEKLFRIVQPTARYTVTELEADIEKHRPDVVYIDGFYFMIDRETGKSGANWEGHDNLANDLKKIGMNYMIPVVITHQVREKQLTGKRGAGIDDGAMMGGTAIIMYADLVLGVDVDDSKLRTLSCTRSRLKYLDTVYGTWNWEDCTFHEQEPSYDPGQFGGEPKEDA